MFVPEGPINNIPALVRIMAWRREGDKPLSESMMVNLPTHICATRPQWGVVTHYFATRGHCFDYFCFRPWPCHPIKPREAVLFLPRGFGHWEPNEVGTEYSWWCHNMVTLSALLGFLWANHRWPVDSPQQCGDLIFLLCMNKPLNKELSCRWY